MTGAMFIDEELESNQPKQHNRPSKSARNTLTDSRVSKSMLQSKTVKQFAIDVLESKYIKTHSKRTSMLRVEINRLVDAFERKTNDLLRIGAERKRLAMYDNLLSIELKRNTSTRDFAFQKAQKEIQKIAAENTELTQKHERLLQQVDQNNKSLEEIRDFWLLVMRSLKEHIKDFDVQASKLDPESLRDFRKLEGSVSSIQRIPNSSRKIRSASISVDRSAKNKPFVLKTTRRPPLAQHHGKSATNDDKKISLVLKRRATMTEMLTRNPISKRNIEIKSGKEVPKINSARINGPVLSTNKNDESTKINPSSSMATIEITYEKFQKLDNRNQNFKPVIRSSSPTPLEIISKKWIPDDVVVEENHALSEYKSITSSIGSSIYKELLEEGPPVSLFSQSGRIIESKRHLSIDQKAKKNFIPVKISFKIGPDNLPSQIKTTHSGERIYQSLQFKRLIFYLNSSGQICGLQFVFFNRLTKSSHDGLLHGKTSATSRSFEFGDEEFLSMAHFQNDTSGIKWIKLFTNKGSLDVGSETIGQPPSGVRYFPREVKLCKLFTYFNSRTDVLAQIRFIYVRTVYY